MTRPLDQLASLATAAEEHSRHVVPDNLSWEHPEVVDRILTSAAQQLDFSDCEALAACYGAWLGLQCVNHWGAQWVGLAEPVAPRINLHGVVFSPIDVVRRAMHQPDVSSVTQSLQKLRALTAQQTSRQEALEINRQAWDQRVTDPKFAGGEVLPATPEQALAAIDPWLAEEGVSGCHLLCLAAGGGRQGPLHAQAGAIVTVVDLSAAQLELDKQAARALHLSLSTVQASLDDLSMLDDQSFDLVLQPVSACYVPDVRAVYREVARVLRPGGLYVVQHKQPASLQSSAEPDDRGGYRWESPLLLGARLPEVAGADTVSHRESGAIEFLHSLEALLGGLCHSGFVIEDVQEPPRADALAPLESPEYRAWFMPPYVKLKARRCRD